MKKVRFLFYGLFAALAVVMVSCYPGGAEYYSDTDIVVTDYDSAFFATHDVKTYFLIDTVAYITDDPEEVKHTYDETILSKIEENLKGVGYTPVDPDGDTPPDVLVTATVSTSTTEGWVPGYPYYPYYPYDWWWGYPGWDWWWGYPGGYYPYYYSFSTGTLFITMGDPNDPINDDGEIKLPVVWGAAFNGMLSSSTTDMKKRIERSIDQAFAQSKCFHK